MTDELAAILDELKEAHGSDAATARAAGLTKGAVSLLRKGERALGLVGLCGLLQATNDITLQTRLLQVSGISNALLRGQRMAVKRGE